MSPRWTVLWENHYLILFTKIKIDWSYPFSVGNTLYDVVSSQNKREDKGAKGRGGKDRFGLETRRLLEISPGNKCEETQRIVRFLEK